MNFTRREFTKLMAGASAAGMAEEHARAASGPIEDMPQNACDCHVHIVGPAAKYPMDPNRTYTAGEASTDELKMLRKRLGIARNVLVQISFYGTDNSCMLDALATLGDSARGVAVVGPDIPDSELLRLGEAGVRGIRLNLETSLTRDPGAASALLETFAKRLAPLGWHVQIYAALPVIAQLAEQIAGLPVPVVIDHFGSPVAANGVTQPGFAALLDLVRSRKAFVKLSGCYRISQAPDYADVAPFARALIEAGPDRLVWASDWPHSGRAKSGSRTEIAPYQQIDDEKVLGLLKQWCPDPAIRTRILADTPAQLYKFPA
jgi:predicted TIM-barrel fold metal-dependent hydrolase